MGLTAEDVSFNPANDKKSLSLLVTCHPRSLTADNLWRNAGTITPSTLLIKYTLNGLIVEYVPHFQFNHKGHEKMLAFLLLNFTLGTFVVFTNRKVPLWWSANWNKSGWSGFSVRHAVHPDTGTILQGSLLKSFLSFPLKLFGEK